MLDETDLKEQNIKSNEERTWGSSITLRNVEYATSLFWQSLQNQEDPNAEVLESSQGVMEGADLYCVKKGKTPQFGICVSSEGYKASEFVASIGLVTALSDQTSFVAVFRVSNGWWYVCVRDDVILANGDMLYLSEEDAKKQFKTMLMVPDWKLKIAPPEWGIDDTQYPDLEEIMDRGSRVKLQKINTRGKYFNIIVGVGAFIILWIVYNVFMSMLDSTSTPMIVPMLPKVVRVDDVVVEPKPWENLTIVSEQMDECYKKTMGLVTIMPPGWAIGGIACSAYGASTSWNRRFGRISIIDTALNKSKVSFAARSISNDGQIVMAAVNFDQLKTGLSAPTMNSTDLKNNLNDLFQSLGMSISLADESYTSPQNNIYRSVKFKFQSNSNPTIWKELLTEFSGITITTITYNTDTGVWDYEGAIYAL